MSHSHEKGLLYGLEARIGPAPAFFAALQHLLASVVGIITPPLIIGSVLGLQAYIPYLISMSLFVSGLGTFMQARRFYGIGAGMICLQGTSFAFLGVILSGGLMVKGRGGSPEEIMAMLFGCNLVAALIPILISRCVGSLRKVLTPVVTGTVITLIGISLIKVSITDWAGGHNATDFGSPGNLALGALTLLVIVALNRSRNRWARLVAVVAGIAVGCVAAALTGHLQLNVAPESNWLVLPAFFRFGFAFDWTIFLPIALVSVIAVIEAVGDLTANCLISQQPITGKPFQQRLQGGIVADGLSCVLAAVFSAHVCAEQWRYPDDRRRQPLRRYAAGNHAGAAGAVSLYWLPVAADPAAGAGWGDNRDVWQRGCCGHPCDDPDAAGSPRDADCGDRFWYWSGRGGGAGCAEAVPAAD